MGNSLTLPNGSKLDLFLFCLFPKVRKGAKSLNEMEILKPEWWNGGLAESQKGEKSPQILKHEMVASRNSGKSTQILKDGIVESRNGGK